MAGGEIFEAWNVLWEDVEHFLMELEDSKNIDEVIWKINKADALVIEEIFQDTSLFDSAFESVFKIVHIPHNSLGWNLPLTLEQNRVYAAVLRKINVDIIIKTFKDMMSLGDDFSINVMRLLLKRISSQRPDFIIEEFEKSRKNQSDMIEIYALYLPMKYVASLLSREAYALPYWLRNILETRIGISEEWRKNTGRVLSEEDKNVIAWMLKDLGTKD